MQGRHQTFVWTTDRRPVPSGRVSCSLVGPKTAVKWLTQFGTLDGVIENAKDIGGVVGENLRRALEWLPLSRQLVTVKCDCDLSGHHVSILESLKQQEGGANEARDEADALRARLDEDPRLKVTVGDGLAYLRVQLDTGTKLNGVFLAFATSAEAPRGHSDL